MLGDRFVPLLKPVPPRHSSRLNLFTRFLDGKINDGVMRASHLTPNGYGARLLTQIIKLADLDTLLYPNDPYHRIGAGLLAIVRDLEKPIDVRIGKHTTTNLFIQSRTPCFELMTASRRRNPLVEIPFDQPYHHKDWQTVQPLRLVDMSSCDLNFQVYNDTLMYRSHGPTHAVYALDCFALVSKFVAYYQAQPVVTNRDQCILDFVHHEVIVPALLHDALAIWLRNTYRQQLIADSPLASRTATLWDVVTIDTLGANFSTAMLDVNYLKTDLVNQSISCQTMLSSLPLTSDGDSFSTYYQNLTATTTMPGEQPYMWVECLKSVAWWEFMLMLCAFSPGYPDIVSFKRALARDIKIWIMVKPWQHISQSVPFKVMIRSRLEGMLDYLEHA